MNKERDLASDFLRGWRKVIMEQKLMRKKAPKPKQVWLCLGNGTNSTSPEAEAALTTCGEYGVGGSKSAAVTAWKRYLLDIGVGQSVVETTPYRTVCVTSVWSEE